MGLDMRIAYFPNGKLDDDGFVDRDCVDNDEMKIIYEGNGRSAYAFLRDWLGDDRYGEYVPLTAVDIHDLIDLAVEQERVAEYSASYNPIVESVFDSIDYGALGFIRAISGVLGLITYAKNGGTLVPGIFAVEADW